MRYFGSKQRIARKLAAFMQPEITRRGAYAEPFVGGAAVLSQIHAPLRQANDINEHLIAMWRALMAGWNPPTRLSESEYTSARNLPIGDPLVAFAGFGCSFGGKWFGGYARSGTRNYAMNARNSCLKKKKGLKGVEWHSGDYRQFHIYEGAVIYCDPPYAGTTQFSAAPAFDWLSFWDYVREAEKEGFCCFVSEYSAPPDFDCVLEISTKTDMHGAGRAGRVERLFRYAK